MHGIVCKYVLISTARKAFHFYYATVSVVSMCACLNVILGWLAGDFEIHEYHEISLPKLNIPLSVSKGLSLISHVHTMAHVLQRPGIHQLHSDTASIPNSLIACVLSADKYELAVHYFLRSTFVTTTSVYNASSPPCVWWHPNVHPFYMVLLQCSSWCKYISSYPYD